MKRLGRGTVAHGILLIMTFVFVVPILWLLSSSLKTAKQEFVFPVQWIPTSWVFSNFTEVFREVPFLRYAANTFLIAGSVVVGTLISCSMVAYAFSRLKWRGREGVFLSVLATMMLPFQATMIPLYLMFHYVGWVGTFLPLIVPAFFGNPFFIFLLRQFYKTINNDISDQAKTDGCSELGVFWRIIIPLSKPALTTTALLSFVWTYTDYFAPLIYLTKPSTYTLSLGLANFEGMMVSQWNLLMAATVWTLIPTLVLYLFAQKKFLSGIQTTAFR